MHARLRPIGGRSGPGFSLYHDKECESQLTIAHAHGPDRALGLCTNPRSPGSNPASKQKVVYVRRPGRRRGTYALLDEDMFWECGTARVSMDCCVRAQTALAARPRSARLLTQPRVLLLERLCRSLRRVRQRLSRQRASRSRTCCGREHVHGEDDRSGGRDRSDEEICYQLRGKFGKSRDEDVEEDVVMVPGTQVGAVG